MGLNKNDAFSPRHVQWVINMGTGNESSDDLSESFESISSEDSANSVETCSSTDTVEDDASSSSSSYGPLYELSELMAQLPIKRGLSKHYQGKSQSFGCLGSVVNLEDLAKKGNISYNKRMKSSKSFAGGLDDKKSSFGPKATITKKSSRRSNLSSVSDTNNCLVGNRRSPISLN